MISPKNVPSAPAPALIHCSNCEVASDPRGQLLPQTVQQVKALTTWWNLPLSTIYWSVSCRGLSISMLYIKLEESRLLKRIKWFFQFCNHITFSLSQLQNKANSSCPWSKRTPVTHRISQFLKTTKRRSNHSSLPEITALEGTRHVQVLINRLINCPCLAGVRCITSATQ